MSEEKRSRIQLKGLPLKELAKQMEQIREQKFRGNQLFDWLYNHMADEWDEMSNIPKPLRRKLSKMCDMYALEKVDKQTSKNGTIKYQFKTSDDKLIESVLIPMGEEKATLCISSQIGCPLDCQFCATGRLGYTRNLTAGEIIDQYILAAKDFGKDRITNIVYMGMGEPLVNFDNTLRTLKIITSEFNKTISRTKVTVSTAGIPQKIRDLADSGLRVKLALSLHSCFEETRSKLMPINEKYPLEHLIRALKYYVKTTDTKITFEYTMLKGINDRSEDLRELVKTCHRLPSKLNLIPFNSIDHIVSGGFPAELKPTPMNEIESFAHALRGKGIMVMIRQPQGDDIAAACGQLSGQLRDFDDEEDED